MSKPYVNVSSRTVYDITMTALGETHEWKDMTSGDAYELLNAAQQLVAKLQEKLDLNNPFKQQENKNVD